MGPCALDSLLYFISSHCFFTFDCFCACTVPVNSFSFVKSQSLCAMNFTRFEFCRLRADPEYLHDTPGRDLKIHQEDRPHSAVFSSRSKFIHSHFFVQSFFFISLASNAYYSFSITRATMEGNAGGASLLRRSFPSHFFGSPLWLF